MTLAPEHPVLTDTVHDLPTPDPQWRLHAACLGEDVERFIIGTDHSRAAGVRNQAARRLCDSCPVWLDCRIAAAIEDDRRAIRGQMTPIERDEWLATLGIRRRPPRELDLVKVDRLREAGLSWPAVGVEMDCTPETAQKQWARAQKALRAGEAA